MRKMLDSQRTELNSVLDEAGLLGEVVLEPSSPSSQSQILRLKSDHEMVFVIAGGGSGQYQLNMSPGPQHADYSTSANDWGTVLKYIGLWATFVKRERAARAQIQSGGVLQAPDWLPTELPPEYQITLEQMAAMQAAADRDLRRAELLWQTGEPLNRRAIAAFEEIGFKAEPTKPGATYDVTVTLPTGRLLVEVTGLEGQVKKASGKISQLFQVQQSELTKGDRGCLLVNAFREKPPSQRSGEILTADSLNLVVMLNSVAFSTTDLYRLVLSSRTDQKRAREIVEGLLSAPAGIVNLS